MKDLTLKELQNGEGKLVFKLYQNIEGGKAIMVTQVQKWNKDNEFCGNADLIKLVPYLHTIKNIEFQDNKYL